MNNIDKEQIVRWANKGMNILQIKARFPGTSFTEIQKIANENLNQNQSENNQRRNQSASTITVLRTPGHRLQSGVAKQRKTARRKRPIKG